MSLVLLQEEARRILRIEILSLWALSQTKGWGGGTGGPWLIVHPLKDKKNDGKLKKIKYEKQNAVPTAFLLAPISSNASLSDDDKRSLAKEINRKGARSMSEMVLQQTGNTLRDQFEHINYPKFYGRRLIRGRYCISIT